jgi:hypothetical protein
MVMLPQMKQVVAHNFTSATNAGTATSSVIDTLGL